MAVEAETDVDDPDIAEDGEAGLAAGAGVSAPVFASALAYHDGYASAVLPANLLQAQRDFFGAHGFRRVDRPGDFHHKWLAE